MESNDPIKELIKVWHDSVVEFGRELKDFINGLPVKRANFWGIDLWLFLQEQRDSGLKVDGESYQRLRHMLEGLRDELIADGVELQQTYTPSAEQTARERANARARNERPAPPKGASRYPFAAMAPEAPPQAPAPTGPGTATPPAPPGPVTTTPPAGGGTTGTAGPGTVSPPKPGTTTTPKPPPAPKPPPPPKPRPQPPGKPPRPAGGVGGAVLGAVFYVFGNYVDGVLDQKRDEGTADAHEKVEDLVRENKLSPDQALLCHQDIEQTPAGESGKEIGILLRINEAQRAGRISEPQAQALVKDLRAIREKHRSIFILGIDFDAVKRDVDARIDALAAQNRPAAPGPTEGGDNGRPIFYVLRSVTPEIAAHDAAAIAAGKPATLTRLVGENAIQANRRAARRGHPKAGSGRSLDEYPFASTVEGGAGASVREVPRSEQSRQGSDLSVFYDRTNTNAGDRFDVKVIS